jgi:FkbM family methyltransferase
MVRPGAVRRRIKESGPLQPHAATTRGPALAGTARSAGCNAKSSKGAKRVDPNSVVIFAFFALETGGAGVGIVRPVIPADLVPAARLVHRALRYRLRLNPGQIRAMLRLLPRGGVALDVGAHKGAYSCWMAWSVGRRGRVLAFEPQDRLAGSAGANSPTSPSARALLGLGLRQVRLFHAAVSDRDGAGTIDVRRSSTHGASLDGIGTVGEQGVDQQPVALVTLDGVAAREGLARVDFVKIDVEGHELAVLRGAAGVLARFRPALLIELEARHHKGASPLDEAAAMLTPLGYEGFYFRRRRERPMAEFTVASHQQYGAGRPGEYCNDFLFVARR